MSFFAGFANEFGTQLQQARTQEADRAEKQQALQAGILQHLATSPDPEIQAHAVAGLLDLAGPQKYAKGLGGFLGKMAENPALGTIRHLIASGRQVPVPEHVPGEHIQPGLPPGAMPGQAMDVEGRPRAAQPPPAGALAKAGGQAPVAAQAPPAPPQPFVAPGDVYTPPRTTTVPRQVFDNPEAVAGKKTYLETQGKLQAEHEAWQAMSPDERAASYLGHALPVQKTTDAQGTVHFFQGGQEISVADQAGMPQRAPRPTAPEASTFEGAKQLLAAANTPEGLAARGGKAMTEDEAINQYRVQQAAEKAAAHIAAVGAAADRHTAALDAHRAAMLNYVKTQQQVNGTTPMTRSQAIAGATQILPKGPETTSEQVGAMADALQALDGGKRGSVVSPIRAGLSQPLAPPPAPPGIAGAVQGAAPALANLPVHPDKAAQTPAQIQTQQRQATKVLGHVSTIQQDIETIDRMGLMGPIGGRWGAFLASGVGALPGSYTPEQERALGKFRTDIGLLKSGMAMVHGGARGGGSVQMMARMDALISADKMDKNLLLGATDAFKDWLTEYAKGPAEGKSPAAAGPPAAPTTPTTTASPAPTTSTLPPGVVDKLRAAGVGRHTLANGQVWVVDAAGNVRPGG